MEYLDNLGKNAKEASKQLNKLSATKINSALLAVAKFIEANASAIIEENKKDILVAEEKLMKPSLIDRLTLTETRIKDMAEGLRGIAKLNSPIGETIYEHKKENGLLIEEKRVPFGVIGIIYESRPNVTVDAFGLCFKTQNAVILRGGSDAINSNTALNTIIKKALKSENVTENAITLITDLSRETATQFMKLKSYVDLLIPRGGAGLIRSVVDNATIPVIETGSGNCHIYVDETADLEMAAKIILNAKTQRYGVCNACESLVVHKIVAEKFLPLLRKTLATKNVEIRGDELSKQICNDFTAATKEDYFAEYLDAIISVKIVDDIDEAIAHINTHSTGHSEAIITKDTENAEKFLNEIDSSTVYVNASTRFTDGFEFGFGAEIGISTQKMHARGAMGLTALTTTKFFVHGNGQIR